MALPADFRINTDGHPPFPRAVLDSLPRQQQILERALGGTKYLARKVRVLAEDCGLTPEQVIEYCEASSHIARSPKVDHEGNIYYGYMDRLRTKYQLGDDGQLHEINLDSVPTSGQAASVFVAYPYSLPADDYRGAFSAVEEKFPGLTFVFADEELTSLHILEKIKSMMERADLGLFDITLWNANVTLELGLAMGLDLDYFILFDPGRTRQRVPSDLGGIDRLEYKSYGQLRDTVGRLIAQEFGFSGTVTRPRRASRALERIRGRMIRGSTNVAARDVATVCEAGLVNEVVALTLEPDAASVKQKQVALALIDLGLLEPATTIATSIRNRSQTEDLASAALHSIHAERNVEPLWSFIENVWPRLRKPQRRNLRELMDELELAPPTRLEVETDDTVA